MRYPYFGLPGAPDRTQIEYTIKVNMAWFE